jgi:hypothetical protein
VFELLPDAILLPIHGRSKAPIYRWRKITFAQSQRPRYRRWLAQRGNCGVVLGKGSNDLCAIDVDHDGFVPEFVNLNPALTMTLCSKGQRGVQFWLHMTGEYPHCVLKLKTTAGTKWGEWRADGGQSIIRGIHPCGAHYRLLCDLPPLAIAFSDIHWPAELVLPWEKTKAQADYASQTDDVTEELARRIRHYLDKIEPSISGNCGDDMLFKVASILVHGFALSPLDALPFLQEYNERAQPPWPLNRLRYKLEEAFEHPRSDYPRGHLRGDDKKREETASVPPQETAGGGDPPLLVKAYYDIARKEFLLQNTASRWHSYDSSQFKLQLRARGFSTKPQEGLVSPAEAVMLSIQNRADVHYAGPLAGRKSGFYQENGIRMLVTTSPEIRIAKLCGWDDINTVICNVIASDQEPWAEQQWIVFNGWLKLAREALKLGKFQPGQALAFAGEVNSGKSLLQAFITETLGGRAAKAAMFLQGRTDFNSDLFGAEHLILEDEAASTSHHARSALAACIKGIAVNKVHQCHGKRRDIVNLSPWWRLSISLNNLPERMMILPQLSDDVFDKITLLRAIPNPMPYPTETADDKAAFWQILMDQLPGYLFWLETQFQIPPEWKTPRFGIKEFHHPELVQALDELNPACVLLELVDQLAPWDAVTKVWNGTSTELRQLLLENDRTRRDATRLLDWTNACGQFLGDLAKIRAERVESVRTSYARSWRVFAPQ